MNARAPFVGVLLCGGSGTRFGGDKLMAGAEPLAVRAARNLLQGTGQVLAVIPPGRTALRGVLEGVGCQVLESDRTALGMGATLAAGVEATAQAAGWVVALGDMPLVDPRTVRALKAALEAGALITAPRDALGRRGHPVGFSSPLRAELLELRGDLGAREVIQRHAAQVVLLVTEDRGIFVDVDTREDLQRLAP